ncbi:hypothetical protein O181_049561 [Austropuccinia psidii MF-1]|uniref:GAG-pre-integrase domain-containing protein n=1 Tax=Austropuccinia psidii MF-1 TaxID=1389203 RepID=A0A9Q3HLH4_9BASI|nr:hypothetical protein [Austropuccinia psidii MF-1]
MAPFIYQELNLQRKTLNEMSVDTGNKPHHGRAAHHQKTPISLFSPIAERDLEWRRKWLTLRNPCFHCSKIGRWVLDCPTRAKAAKARTKLNQKSASIAEIGVVPALEQNEASLDSGATHSVVGNLSLFSHLWDADMTLSVASRKMYPVVTIGQIILKTKTGTLIVDGRLYCKHIPGMALSIGHLLKQGIGVDFYDDVFSLQQNASIFRSHFRNYRCFIGFKNLNNVSLNHISASENSPMIKLSTRLKSKSVDTSLLWHRHMGHFSIGSIKRLLKFKATDGISSIKLDPIGICHPCSVAKSQHRPFQGISQRMIEGPGDIIKKDLMGPLPPGLDHKKYVLTIQAIFSHLTVAIPLLDKAGVKI